MPGQDASLLPQWDLSVLMAGCCHPLRTSHMASALFDAPGKALPGAHPLKCEPALLAYSSEHGLTAWEPDLWQGWEARFGGRSTANVWFHYKKHQGVAHASFECGTETRLLQRQFQTKGQQLRLRSAFIIIKNRTLVFVAMRLTYHKNQNFKISPLISQKFYLALILIYKTVHHRPLKMVLLPRIKKSQEFTSVLISNLMPPGK